MIVLTGIFLGGGYLYLRLDDEIRRQVENRIAEHYPDMVVHVGRARFEQDRGVVIYDIALAERRPDANSQPLLSIGEMNLAGKLRLEELVMSELAIDEIVVRRAALRAVRRADGSWNLASLLPLPHFGSQSPTICVEDATLIVEDASRPAATRTIQGVDFTLTPVLDSNGVAKEGKHFYVKGAAAGAPARELMFEGEIGAEDGMINLTSKVAGLEVSSETIVALPGLSTNAMAGVEMSGRADATITVARASESAPLQWSADIAFDRGRLNHSLLPEPLTEIRFSATANAGQLSIKRLDARYGSAAVAMALERVGWLRNSPVSAAVSIVGLTLDDQLPAQMPESLARIWKRFKPIGLVDATLQLQFDGKEWRPNLTANCRNFSMTDMEHFSYPVQQAAGQVVYQPPTAGRPDVLTIDLTGNVSGKPVRVEVNLQQLQTDEPEGLTTSGSLSQNSKVAMQAHEASYRGRLAQRLAEPDPHPVGWVKVSGTEIPIHEQLIAAIPGNGQPFVRSLQAQGAVDFVFRSEWKDPLQLHADVTLDIGLRGCSIKYEGFPLPMRGVNGIVSAHNWRWKVKDLVAYGAHDSTVIQCAGEVNPLGSGWQANLAFDVDNLPLDESLKNALQSQAAHQAWDELRPQGQIDVDVQVMHDTHQSQPVVQIEIRPCGRSVSLNLVKFPYRLEEIQGEATYNPGRVEFRNLIAKHNLETYSIERGAWNATGDGGWQVLLTSCNVDRLSPHRELLNALPPRLQKTIDIVNPSGTFGVYNSNLSFTKPAGTERVAASWDINLDCHQAVFRGNVPIQSASGSVRFFGRDDSQIAYSAGEMKFDSIVVRDLQLTNVRGPMWLDSSICFFGEQATQKLGQPPRRITADAYGGSLSANVAIQHDTVSNYHVDLLLGGGDLARFNNERLGGPNELNGTVSGRLALAGSGTSLQSLNGNGELHVVNANIYKLPLLVSMLKVPNLRNRTPDTTAFNRCDMKFKIQGEHIYFDQLNLLGDAVSLYGKGESGFDRHIDLVFYTLLEPAMPIPLWKTVAGQVSQQTLQLNVVGTWNNPDVRPNTLPGVSQVLEQIQTEFQGATGGLPDTASRGKSSSR